MLTTEKNTQKHYTGLGCPRCSCELVESTPGFTLGNGKQKEVSCLVCDYASVVNLETLQLEKNF